MPQHTDGEKIYMPDTCRIPETYSDERTAYEVYVKQKVALRKELYKAPLYRSYHMDVYTLQSQPPVKLFARRAILLKRIKALVGNRLEGELLVNGRYMRYLLKHHYSVWKKLDLAVKEYMKIETAIAWAKDDPF